jgi:hypothetical protein
MTYTDLNCWGVTLSKNEKVGPSQCESAFGHWLSAEVEFGRAKSKILHQLIDSRRESSVVESGQFFKTLFLFPR